MHPHRNIITANLHWFNPLVKIPFPGNLVTGVRCEDITTEHQLLQRDEQDPKSGSVEYVHIRTPGSSTTILVNQGQARGLDKTSIEQWREFGQQTGTSILLHNYPGYGRTSGPVTQTQILADLDLLVEMLNAGNVANSQIVLLGNSIGCGPTLHLAATGRGFKKVIVISPYVSCFELGGFLLSPFKGWSRFDPFCCIQCMPNLTDMDVLIVHGEADTTIPCSNSQVLFDAIGTQNANHHHVQIPGAKHKYARLRALDAIRYFINDDKMLQQKLNRLAAGSGVEAVGTNPHSD